MLATAPAARPVRGPTVERNAPRHLSPVPRGTLALLAGPGVGRGRVAVARLRRGHYPLPQRRRPVRRGDAPRHRHRRTGRHARRCRGGGHGHVGGGRRQLGSHGRDRHGRAGHELSAPLLGVGRAGRPGRGGRSARGRRHERDTLRGEAAPPLRRARGGHRSRLPRSARLPAAGSRSATARARARACTGARAPRSRPRGPRAGRYPHHEAVAASASGAGEGPRVSPTRRARPAAATAVGALGRSGSAGPARPGPQAAAGTSSRAGSRALARAGARDLAAGRQPCGR